jgi:hypothetical protein
MSGCVQAQGFVLHPQATITGHIRHSSFLTITAPLPPWLQAVVTEIKRMHQTGRPVLVGTTSVEKSEYLSSLLTEQGIKHQVGACVEPRVRTSQD